MQAFGHFSSNKMEFYELNGMMGHLCLHKNDLYAHLIRKRPHLWGRRSKYNKYTKTRKKRQMTLFSLKITLL